MKLIPILGLILISACSSSKSGRQNPDPGTPCSSNAPCTGANIQCIKSFCRDTTKLTPCNATTPCASGSTCSSATAGYCTASDGTACSNNTSCASYYCNDGKCLNSADEPCNQDSECGSEFCVQQKCVAEGPGTANLGYNKVLNQNQSLVAGRFSLTVQSSGTTCSVVLLIDGKNPQTLSTATSAACTSSVKLSMQNDDNLVFYPNDTPTAPWAAHTGVGGIATSPLYAQLKVGTSPAYLGKPILQLVGQNDNKVYYACELPACTTIICTPFLLCPSDGACNPNIKPNAVPACLENSI